MGKYARTIKRGSKETEGRKVKTKERKRTGFKESWRTKRGINANMVKMMVT